MWHRGNYAANAMSWMRCLRSHRPAVGPNIVHVAMQRNDKGKHEDRGHKKKEQKIIANRQSDKKPLFSRVRKFKKKKKLSLIFFF